MRLLFSLPLDKYPTLIPTPFWEALRPELVKAETHLYVLDHIHQIFKLKKYSILSKKFGHIDLQIFHAKCAAAFSLDTTIGQIVTSRLEHGSDFVTHAVPLPDDLARDAPADGMMLVFPRCEALAAPIALLMKTADCLALAYTYTSPTHYIFALVHAGWRGLTQGIISGGVARIQGFVENLGETFEPRQLSVYLAPAIFGASYECQEDVLHALVQHRENLGLSERDYQLYALLWNTEWSEETQVQRCFPDLQLLAALELRHRGVEDISILRENTYTHPEWASFRRACHTGGNQKERNDTVLLLRP